MLPVALLTPRAAMRFLIGVLLAASLIGCGSKLALKPMWVSCPAIDIHSLSWLPGRNQIAYLATDSGGVTILNSIDPMSGNKTQLAGWPAYAYPPAWSPDGRHLLSAHSTIYDDY